MLFHSKKGIFLLIQFIFVLVLEFLVFFVNLDFEMSKRRKLVKMPKKEEAFIHSKLSLAAGIGEFAITP